MKTQLNTSSKICKFLAIVLCLLLIFQQSGFAQIAGQLDISGHLAGLRNAFAPDIFRPLHLRYLSYNPVDNNFQLFLDKGSLKNPNPQELQDTTKTLLNYFFVGISLPNDTFWVNLRPDAENNIIDARLAQTDVGKILLESDLQLKKDTAKFTSPETPEGKEYWDKLYKKAGEIFGSENITIPTLTRPWIVPDEIIIRETVDSAYIYKATLKVMLEQDYLKDSAVYNFKDDRLKELNEYSSQLIREIIIPKLTKEVNSSKRYASLRQVYYSLIMAQWFKARNLGKDGLYSHLIDRKDLTNLTSKESWSKTTYFKEYQKSFKDGEYNIQEPIYTPYGQTIRSYFSGGEIFSLVIPERGNVVYNLKTGTASSSIVSRDPANLNPKVGIGVKVDATGEVKIEGASSSLTQEPKSASSSLGDVREKEKSTVELFRKIIENRFSEVSTVAMIEGRYDALKSDFSIIEDESLRTKVLEILESRYTELKRRIEAQQKDTFDNIDRMITAISLHKFNRWLLRFERHRNDLIVKISNIYQLIVHSGLDSQQQQYLNGKLFTIKEQIKAYSVKKEWYNKRTFSNPTLGQWLKAPPQEVPLENPQDVIRYLPQRTLGDRNELTPELKERLAGSRAIFIIPERVDYKTFADEVLNVIADAELPYEVAIYVNRFNRYMAIHIGTPFGIFSKGEGKSFIWTGHTHPVFGYATFYGHVYKNILPEMKQYFLNLKEPQPYKILEQLGLLPSTGSGNEGYEYEGDIPCMVRSVAGPAIEENIIAAWDEDLVERKLRIANKAGYLEFYLDPQKIRQYYKEIIESGEITSLRHKVFLKLLNELPNMSRINALKSFFSISNIGLHEELKETMPDRTLKMLESLADSQKMVSSPLDKKQSASSEMEKAKEFKIDMLIALIDYSLAIEQKRLEVVKLALKNAQEKGANIEEIRDRIERITEQSKTIEEMESIRKKLGVVTDFKDLMDVLRPYSVKPKRIQKEVLSELKKRIPDFEENSVLFINPDSFLGALFRYKSTNRGQFLPLSKENKGIRLINTNLTDPIALIDVLIHEDTHKMIKIKGSNEIERSLREGIATFLTKRRIREIINSDAAFAKKLRREIMSRLSDDPKMVYAIFGDEIALEEIICSRLVYREERQFVEAIVKRFGDDFIMSLASTGDVSLLKDKLGQVYDYLLKAVEPFEDVHLERWQESIFSNTFKFIISSDKFSKKDLELIVEITDIIHEKLIEEISIRDYEFGKALWTIVYRINKGHLLEKSFEKLRDKIDIEAELNNALEKEIGSIIADISKGKNKGTAGSAITGQEKSASSVMKKAKEHVDRKGGIDFRSLPIVTQAMSNLSANISSSAIQNLISINLDDEWLQIERMASSGITPSSERIKEYIQTSCAQDNITQDRDKILLCISDILRLEEERCDHTNATLRDILVVLESMRNTQELRQVFLGKTI